MTLPTIKTFKSVRKEQGTVWAMCAFLSAGGLCEHRVERAMDGIVADLGLRALEQMKSKDVYDLCDGFILACQEHLITN
jgi:hypothetical protein